jgi:hypothetical protein
MVSRLLQEEINLGTNTGVAVFTATYHRTFVLTSWTHQRPLGISVPNQCPACCALASVKYAAEGDFRVRFKCRVCKSTVVKDAPERAFYPASFIRGKMDRWALLDDSNSIRTPKDLPGYVNREFAEAGSAMDDEDDDS